jgi:hypothetical protein
VTRFEDKGLKQNPRRTIGESYATGCLKPADANRIARVASALDLSTLSLSTGAEIRQGDCDQWGHGAVSPPDAIPRRSGQFRKG